MIYLGIDPGITGALVALNDDLSLHDYIHMPVLTDGKKKYVDAVALYQWISAIEADFAVIEKVHAMPGQGVTSMFSFGRSYGLAEGALASSGITYQRVTPQAWKKAFGFIGEGKDATREAALERFKSPAFKPKGKGQALADAAYIALWGAQNAA